MDALRETSLTLGGLVDDCPAGSPPRSYADMTIDVAVVGGRCGASTVPMATTLDGVRRVLDAQRVSGTTYLVMMETMVVGREYLHVPNFDGKAPPR